MARNKYPEVTVERILDGIGELKTLHGADKPEGGDAA